MALLIKKVAPDEEPVLSDEDLYGLLDRAAVATVWTAATAYSYGDVILPTTRDGHRYRVVTPGTSDSTEPTWNTEQAGYTTDGDDLVWQEDGRQYSDLWDIDRAAHEGWLLKASLAASDYEFTDSGLNLKRQQVAAGCRAQAKCFAPVGVY